jgi:hypothetical protein
MPRFVNVAIIFIIAGLLMSACSTLNNNVLSTEKENNQEIDSHPTPSDSPANPSLDSKENETIENKYSDLEIITLLPKDAIRAIDNPQFLTPDEANNEYAPDELILGVEFNGDARAYSVNFLSRHEIVNDTVGNIKIAVTW